MLYVESSLKSVKCRKGQKIFFYRVQKNTRKTYLVVECLRQKLGCLPSAKESTQQTNFLAKTLASGREWTEPNSRRMCLEASIHRWSLFRGSIITWEARLCESSTSLSV